MRLVTTTGDIFKKKIQRTAKASLTSKWKVFSKYHIDIIFDYYPHYYILLHI